MKSAWTGSVSSAGSRILAPSAFSSAWPNWSITHPAIACPAWIYGSTGMGKTRIMQKFLRDHRAHFDKKLGRTRLPVVSIQMPPTPYPRDLYEEILVAMGGVCAFGTSATAWRHRIRALAEQLAVRMLIIDEIHALLVGTPREQRIILP